MKMERNKKNKKSWNLFRHLLMMKSKYLHEGVMLRLGSGRAVKGEEDSKHLFHFFLTRDFTKFGTVFLFAL